MKMALITVASAVREDVIGTRVDVEEGRASGYPSARYTGDLDRQRDARDMGDRDRGCVRRRLSRQEGGGSGRLPSGRGGVLLETVVERDVLLKAAMDYRSYPTDRTKGNPSGCL